MSTPNERTLARCSTAALLRTAGLLFMLLCGPADAGPAADDLPARPCSAVRPPPHPWTTLPSRRPRCASCTDHSAARCVSTRQRCEPCRRLPSRCSTDGMRGCSLACPCASSPSATYWCRWSAARWCAKPRPARCRVTGASFRSLAASGGKQADGDWSRAAFPLMLVNDTENHAHQGLATFLYQDGKISFVARAVRAADGALPAEPALRAVGIDPGDRVINRRGRASSGNGRSPRLNSAARLPARPLAELRASLPPGTLDGFGGPILPKWQVALGLVRDGTLYYEASPTTYGSYPYPLEMRFGVRSVMKAIAPPWRCCVSPKPMDLMS